ncbi:MAG: putative toxin-antitoxin system toxin component, PIN family [Bacteroidota bacterium]
MLENPDMINNKIKIIIDTNLWISYLISRKYTQLDGIINNKQIELLFSKELIEEILMVMQRPKLASFFSHIDVENIMYLIENIGKLIQVSSNISICRDVKDNFLLNLAKDGKANFLITGDNDLLVLKKINKTQIITMNDFLSKFDT